MEISSIFKMYVHACISEGRANAMNNKNCTAEIAFDFVMEPHSKKKGMVMTAASMEKECSSVRN